MSAEPAQRPRRADFVRFLWRALVAAVFVYVVSGAILIFSDPTDTFSSEGSGVFDFVNDLSGMSFRVGAGSLALLAGLALSSRDYDE